MNTQASFLPLYPFLVHILTLHTGFSFHWSMTTPMKDCGAVSLLHIPGSLCNRQYLKRDQTRGKWQGRARSIKWHYWATVEVKHNCSADSLGTTLINHNNADGQGYIAWHTYGIKMALMLTDNNVWAGFLYISVMNWVLPEIPWVLYIKVVHEPKFEDWDGHKLLSTWVWLQHDSLLMHSV